MDRNRPVCQMYRYHHSVSSRYSLSKLIKFLSFNIYFVLWMLQYFLPAFHFVNSIPFCKIFYFKHCSKSIFILNITLITCHDSPCLPFYKFPFFWICSYISLSPQNCFFFPRVLALGVLRLWVAPYNLLLCYMYFNKLIAYHYVVLLRETLYVWPTSLITGLTLLGYVMQCLLHYSSGIICQLKICLFAYSQLCCFSDLAI